MLGGKGAPRFYCVLKARGGFGICAGPGGVRSSGGMVTVTMSPLGGDNKSGYTLREVVSSAAWISQAIVATGCWLSVGNKVATEAVACGC